MELPEGKGMFVLESFLEKNAKRILDHTLRDRGANGAARGVCEQLQGSIQLGMRGQGGISEGSFSVAEQLC